MLRLPGGPVLGLLKYLLLGVLLVSCAMEPDSVTPSTPVAVAGLGPVFSPTPTTTTPEESDRATPPATEPTPTPAPVIAPPIATTPLSTMAVTPGPAGRCGIHLPVVMPGSAPTVTELESAVLLDSFPEEVRPVIAHMLAAPDNVGLAAYRIGDESNGIYLNADAAMPLASVVKIIHLLAYADAVSTGELNPATLVPVSDLQAYYLPNSDLGAHPTALEAFEAEGRILGDPAAVRLEDVPRMMIQYSSNAASDYLHMLLGQERIEQTIIGLGLQQHAAPCPFIGQFLLMGDDRLVRELIADPNRYGVEVMSMTAQYAEDDEFRASIGGWRGRSRRPDLTTQRLFAGYLNTQGSAADYAYLMARIATNDLGTWEKMVLIRRYLEWPTFFPVNQELMAWLGYKGGSLPGVLTSAYYAQPWWRTQPVVVALFFRDLPNNTYQQWLRDQTHDELVRWLLREPDAIPLLKSLLETAR